MKSLGEQFLDIISPRVEHIEARVTHPAAEAIDERMKHNTARGSGFANDPYDNTYSESHAKERHRQGLGGQRSPVTLRMHKRRIEDTDVGKAAGGAEKGTIRISFHDEDASKIFNYHHTGTAKGNKVRSIFPKAPESVPSDIIEGIQTNLTDLLRGQ